MILDGKQLAGKILKDLKEQIKEKQLKLKLAVVFVGESEVSKLYIEKKREAALEVGIDFELFKFPPNISQEELGREIRKISEDASGVVIQLPLPSHINTGEILELVPIEKDVEGFVSDNNSPVVLAIEELLKEYDISLEDKNILIIGKGRLIGKPVAKWLESKNVDFKIIDKSVEDLSALTLEADIIISGTGMPNLIKEDMVKEGVIIIDAGTCRVDGKTVGDIDFKNVCNKSKCITPCVGGIGPVNVACLFKNLVKISIDK